MRKKFTILNSIFGTTNRIVVMITSFIVRYFLARYLISDYLGLNGLFANILGVLSLVDMGLGTAISFSLYKPLHENDDSLVASIMNMYKKIYISIGCLIFLLSLIITPFLGTIIRDTTVNMWYIKKAFIVYSLGVSITYFFSYNRTLIFATQRNFIVQVVDTAINIFSSITQIITLVMYQDFILYIAVQFGYNLLANIVVTIVCKRYCNFKKSKEYELPNNYKKHLFTQVKALAVTNLCGTAINSTDSILISSLTSMMDLAMNSNYALLITAIKSLVTTAIGGATASIGDLIAEGNNLKINYYFEKYNFLYFVVASFCSIAFYCLVDPAISLWVGEKYVFSQTIKVILVFNLYILLDSQPVYTFQNLAGLYVLYRNVSIIAAVLNLVVSIVLGYLFGIIGIFIGTAVSYTYNLIFCNKILHRDFLKKNSLNYWKNQISYLFFTFVIFILMTFINMITIQNVLFKIVFNGTILLFCYVFILNFCFKTNEHFIYFINLLKRRT